MSPTSYQAAPPRVSTRIIAAARGESTSAGDVAGRHHAYLFGFGGSAGSGAEAAGPMPGAIHALPDARSSVTSHRLRNGMPRLPSMIMFGVKARSVFTRTF